jgi:hypothetical protein
VQHVSLVAIKVSFGENIVRQNFLKEVTMIKDCARSFLLVILLAALPVTGWAQDAKKVLGKVSLAMGVESVRTLEYSGSGSNWDEKGQHAALNSYRRELTLYPLPTTAPWNEQVEFWITPYGFLKGAQANSATVEAKSAYGEAYRVVTVSLPGNHKVVAYINDKDMVERVQTTTDDGVTLEGVYRDYTDFRGLKVPSILIRSRGGALVQVVIVKDAKITGI